MGGVVILVKDERVVFIKSFGYYDLERMRKVIVNIWFFIGFLIKVFISVVIVKFLVEYFR